MKAPQNKTEMYKHYLDGEFYCSPKIWRTKEELIKDGYTGLVGLRYAGMAGGGYFRALMTLEEAEKEKQLWMSKGAEESRIWWCESIVTEDIIFQGEVTKNHNHYSLTYTVEKNAINRPRTWKRLQTAEGLKAKLILNYYLSFNSFDVLEELFEKYSEDNVVIEFSTLSKSRLPKGQNTVFWEVRVY